jgi:hypothetical protein
MRQHRSPSLPGAVSDVVGLDLKSCARGYPVYRVPTVAPGPTSGEAVNPQVGPIPFPLCGFDDICT